MGFIPTSKGDFTQTIGLRQEGQLWVQRQSRNYLCGQMAIGHPLTQAFLDELRRRTSTLYLVVYEGTHADATVHPTEPDLFISRHRSAFSKEDLNDAEFSTTVTLEDLKNELRMRKSSMYDPIVVDSWQFIIIDREFGLPLRLMNVVQDALLMLVGDPSPRQMAKRVVREVLPPSVQEIFLEEIQISCPSELRYPAPHEVQHEGNRYRCYDPDLSIIAAQKKKMTSKSILRDANRLIRRCIEDMERYGIVTLASEYEKPQTRPIIVQGSDGSPDLYFPYEEESIVSESERAPSLPLPSASCLSDFAISFRQKEPTAIFAKGSIQTHYCAWPMPAIKSLGRSGLNFATWEGHVYRWNAMRKFLLPPPPSVIFHNASLFYTLPEDELTTHQHSTAPPPPTPGNTTSSTSSTRNTTSSCSTSPPSLSAPRTPTTRSARRSSCSMRWKIGGGGLRCRGHMSGRVRLMI